MNNSNHNITSLGAVFIFAALTTIMILNSQHVYSQNPDTENPEVSHLDVNNTSTVSKFSVAAWFKTSNDFKSDAFIVNKAGDTGNLNYGIWMTNEEKIQAGFETSGGKPMYATSPLSYSDGKWHYAVVTYDGSFVNLYVDGIQVATKPTSGTPDNGGNEPVRLGANSDSLNNYFVGEVDEVRVWKNALTAQQVVDAFNGNINTKDQIMYLDFSEPINSTSPVNQTAINATSPVNQTATNATSPVNQTATNATSAVNQTAINETSIKVANETKIANETKVANEKLTNATKNKGTNETILSLVNPHVKNETGTTNQTGVENQTSESKISKENNLPMAFDQTVTVDQNKHVDITLVPDDKDKDQLQFAITTDPSHGSLAKFDKDKGTVSYIPEMDYSGNDKFSFRATDINGGQSEPANVDIKVNSVNQPNENQTNDNTNTQSAKSAEVSSNETSSAKTAQTNSAQANQPPKADAGDDQRAKVNDAVKLDGGKSSDADGKIVSYKWEQTDGPSVTLDKANEQVATFNVPDSAAGSKLSFKLTVTDDKDASISDDVTVQVQKVADNTADKTDTTQQTDATQGTAAATQVKENVTPKADAGDDQKAKVNDAVKLDGGKSSDADGKIASYKWEQTDGPKVDLKNPDEKIASFDVPLRAADSKLSFKLTVGDDRDGSDSDESTVQVEKVAQQTQGSN